MPRLRELIESEAAPFLARAASLDGLLRLAAEAVYPSIPCQRKIVAFTLAKTGQLAKARSELISDKGFLQPDKEWQREEIDRIDHLVTLIDVQPSALSRQLAQWEGETAQRLGHTAYRIAMDGSDTIH